ncbi:AraC family transcriptional regulator [Natronospirillum operosum]|uniref:AraC family transcriptional regulator n=1 Tax=Natronospirillum operosum TaxID=2759953 RepID=A0A4Z0WBV6_9GAMM|nr:AraC family transcriptional regulator [Natronospirillum operosum]TGG91695.1 AraC family transcriptional regulator [Natronospirillum operosum]
MAAAGTHQAISHCTGLPGVQALTLRSDHSFPRHSHDQYGVGYIVRGAQRSWSGRGQVEAVAGDLITVNPGEMHDGSALTDGGRQWHMIYLDPDRFPAQLAQEGACTEAELTRPVFRHAALAGQFRAAFRALANPACSTESREEQLVLLVCSLFAELGAQPARRGCAAPNLKPVLEYLHDAPEMSVSLGDLARQADLSRFQLIRAFKAQLGITPHAYLSQLRVNQARRLISQGLPIAEAALAAGFSDQSHLNRVFRNQFGITPGRWQRAATA